MSSNLPRRTIRSTKDEFDLFDAYIEEHKKHPGDLAAYHFSFGRIADILDQEKALRVPWGFNQAARDAMFKHCRLLSRDGDHLLDMWNNRGQYGIVPIEVARGGGEESRTLRATPDEWAILEAVHAFLVRSESNSATYNRHHDRGPGTQVSVNTVIRDALNGAAQKYMKRYPPLPKRVYYV